MRTTRPISTISYNSESFLLHQLKELVKEHKISDYMYIIHKAESDEKKDHIHLWLKPNTLIDTMDIQSFLTEIDYAHPDKPFRCIDFRLGAIDDWLLYNQHYEPYLASKFESREHHYCKFDFRFLDEDTFEDNYKHAFFGSDWAHRNQILEQLSIGQCNPANLILNGTIPLNMASQLNAFEYMRNHYGLDRGSRDNHEEE